MISYHASDGIHLRQIFLRKRDIYCFGIMAGLVLGKVVGIAGATLLAAKLGLGVLPEGTKPGHIIGVGCIGGIGFTMSIFIAELAFKGQYEALILAKTGVLFSSVIAGVIGMTWLYLYSKKEAAVVSENPASL